MSSLTSAATGARLPFPRASLNRALNLALFLGGCLLAGTGWLMDQRLPRGRAGHGLTVLGWDRHQWGDLHAWTGYVLVVLVGLHLLLHAAWLRRVATQGHPWRLAAGLTAGAVIVGFFLLLPVRG